MIRNSSGQLTRAVVLTLAVALAAFNAPSSPAGAQEPEIDAPDPDAYVPPTLPIDNPDIPAEERCGLDIAIVMDLSNSVDDTELAQFKAAARDFVTALEGTASAVGIYNFATFAPANASAANAPLVLQEVSSATGATAARSKITGLTRPTNATGGTNWDRGLGQVTDSGQHYDAVLFLTDGDPTAYGVPPDQPPGNTDFGTGVDQVDVEAAVSSATALKDALTRIVAVGIGTGESPGSVIRLQAISGPTENVDYFLGDFEVLSALLTQFASGICNATINVDKLVRSAATGTTSPGGGWTFASAGEDVTPASATTLASGDVTFTAAFTDTTQPARPVTITETLQPGYVLEPQANGANATCVDDDAQPVTVTNVGATGFTLDVAALDNLTCTVINREQAPPLLTLVKQVVNDDGGAALPTAWTLSATGPSTISGPTGSAEVTDVPVPAGTYTLAEAGGPAGYAPSDWLCDGGTLEGATLTLALDDDVTCTITNDDIAPTLTLVKDLVQDPASPTLPTAWTLTATGPTSISGATGEPAVTSAPVDAGVYTLTEAGPADYDLTGWACTGAPLTGDTVTIPLAADVTCTATNEALPSWTLAKTSTPASGSVVARGSDITYTLTVTNTSNATVTDIVVTDDLSDVLDDAALDAGSITASAGTAGLTGTDLVWTVPSVAAGATETVTYTVTVDDDAFSAALRNVATGDGDVPPDSCPPGSTDCTTAHQTPDAPRLTLIKALVNDNGGDATAADWTLSATGPSEISGITGNPEITAAPVDAGVYTLSEDGPAGYEASEWECVGGTQDGDQIELGEGDNVVCTITNDDIAPTLTLVKELDQSPESPVEPTAWTLTATGPTPITGATGEPEVTGVPVDVGSYGLSESGGIAGFELVGWECTGAPVSGDATVVIPLAADVTCTATNRPLPVDLQIDKQDGDVVVDEGDTFEYDIVVTNVGAGAATNVVVTDEIPPTLAVDTASITAPTGWTVEVTGQDADGFGGTLTATFPGPFLPGASDTITVPVTVGELPQPDPGTPPSPIVNTAVVESDEPDENPDDNTSTEDTPVVGLTLVVNANCDDDIAVFDYAIEPVNFTPTSLTLNLWSLSAWNDGNPTGDPIQTITLPPDQLTGSVLWPGITVDAAGNPLTWPGYIRQPDGTWVLDPDSPESELLTAMVVEVVANPTVASAVAYPPGAPVCAPPQPVPPVPPVPPGPDGPDGPSDRFPGGGSSGGGRLPVTGADLTWLALAGAGSLVAGSGSLRSSRAGARRRHRRQQHLTRPDTM